MGRRSNEALCVSCPLFRVLMLVVLMLVVLILVREVVVALLRMDERSEVDAEVDAGDVREGGLVRDRDCGGGGGGGRGRRVVGVVDDDVDTDLETEGDRSSFVPGR